MNTYKLLAISGSLRKASYNTALVKAFEALAPENVEIEHADISTIAMYNQDNDAAFPPDVIELKAKIRAADGIIIATPEYNRSIPGVLKNALDYTSRPYGDGAWTEKPVYVVGASIAGTGTALAQAELRKVLMYFNCRVLGQPEFYCASAAGKFNEAGELTDEDTKKYIVGAFAAFTAFIDRVRD